MLRRLLAALPGTLEFADNGVMVGVTFDGNEQFGNSSLIGFVTIPVSPWTLVDGERRSLVGRLPKLPARVYGLADD